MEFPATFRKLSMQHPNKKIKDFRRLYQLYEAGTVFTAFDTETSTITPTTGRIIEIGAVKFNKNGVISTWSRLFDPGQELSPFIVELTHITQEMVDSADHIESHINTFLHLIKDTVLIAHNAQFDLNFLNAECQHCKLPETRNKVIDTLELSKWRFPLLPKHKLDFLADYFKIDKGSSHRALDDAKTCMELFLKCIERED